MKSWLLNLFLFITIAASAQKTVHHQSLYWIRFQTQLNFSPQIYWTNEVDNRRFFDPDVQNQFIFHSRLHYRRGPWDFGGGLSLSWAFAQIPQNGYRAAIVELRPVAEVSHETLLGNTILMNRIRIDNRFFEMNTEESIWQNSRYVLRWRYRLQAKIPLRKSDGITKTWLRLAEEIMLNQQGNTFDQNRIYVTGEFYLNRSFALEAGYIYIYQQRYGLDDFFSRHVLRFSVLYKIDVKD